MEVDTARRHYKKKWSDYKEWEQQQHAEAYLLFPENMSHAIAIDEVSLTRGELYTESLNAQIKLFRANLRGVTDTKYFLYRLQKIFA